MNNYRVQTANKGSKCRRLITSIAAAIIFIVVLGIGTVSYAFPETAATVTATSANIRAAADPSSAILASVKQGDVVSVFGEATGTDGIKWYHMHVDADTQGYIRSDLVSLGQGSLTTNTTTTTPTTTTTTTTTNLPETQVTPVETKQATVETNNVRIRKGASTEYGIVATANRGMIVNVTGEAAGTDGKTWYQVSFTYDGKEITGFIRSDLVTFESLPADTTTSQIDGTTVPEQQPEAETTVEPETEPETTEQEPEEEEPVNVVTLMNTDKEPYIPGGFVKTVLGWQDQEINAYRNGAFYIFYANRNGEEGWYLYDSENGTYMRYVYETATATIPEEKTTGMAPVIILAIVIVVLIAVIAVMFLKLREYTGDYDYDEDDEDDD
ncbi:MAG: SH3 domain-containing protein, partial [Lachnospiraceae bacterium]|nr:SH3 domain-containing protein [Lachnospiraceae bacterium]